MFKKIAHSAAIALALTLIAVPVKQASAQAPVVTGANPMPTGEPTSSAMMMLMFASAASTV